MKKVTAIACSSTFSYVISTFGTYNQAYTFGLGDNYVLGTKDDETQFNPYKVDCENIYRDRNLRQVAIGTQHVIVLTDEGVEKPAEAEEDLPSLKMEIDEPVEAKEEPVETPAEVEPEAEATPEPMEASEPVEAEAEVPEVPEAPEALEVEEEKPTPDVEMPQKTQSVTPEEKPEEAKDVEMAPETPEVPEIEAPKPVTTLEAADDETPFKNEVQNPDSELDGAVKR